MRKRAQGATALETPFDTIGIDRLSWIGFGIAAIGWALFIGEATHADIISVKWLRPSSAALHADILETAKCIIASGFALALVGGLRAGFGTLNRFFAAVLTRSARRDTETPHPAERTAATPSSILRRPYRTFADGSVEVDTIVGTRLFRSMTEARDFI
jgi:hypothetical protein